MVWVSASSQSQIHLLDCVREPVNQSISTAAKIEAWLKTLLMIQMHKNNGKVMKKSFSKSAFPFFHLPWFHRKPSILWERNHKTTKLKFHFWCSNLRPWNRSSRLSRLAKRFDKCSCSAFISDSWEVTKFAKLETPANLNQEDSRIRDSYLYFCTYW